MSAPPRRRHASREATFEILPGVACSRGNLEQSYAQLDMDPVSTIWAGNGIRRGRAC